MDCGTFIRVIVEKEVGEIENELKRKYTGNEKIECN